MARTKARNPKKHEDKPTVKPSVEADAAKVRKPHRYRPGTVALREIRRYQRSTDLLVQRAPMKRLVREIGQGLSTNPIRFKSKALDAIHAAAESYLQDVFKKSIAISLNGKSVTLKARDMACARYVMSSSS